jgi:hypothetical protein
MRLGCSGCLVVVVLLAVAIVAVGGAIGAGRRILATPDVAGLPTPTAADGSRAQRKVFDLVRRTRDPRPVTLTEAEVNALLMHHLVEARGVRIAAVGARLVGDDRVELTGRAPLHQLFEEAGIPLLNDVLPKRWQDRPVWLHVGARVRVDPGPRPQLRLEVEDFAVGRQRLPARLLRLLLDPAALGLLRWPLPEHVQRVTVEPGRVVIRGAS